MRLETSSAIFRDVEPDDAYLSDGNPFVIAGLVHRHLGLLFGKQASGKSTVAGSIALAVATGQPEWMGQEVYASGHVLVIALDEVDEWRERLARQIADSSSAITTTEVKDGSWWKDASDFARERDTQLVIIDNLTALSWDLNADKAINAVYDQAQIAFLRHRIPVLMLAHASEKPVPKGFHGVPTPMGSSAISMRPRWRVNAYQSEGKLRLWAGGNAAASGRMALTLPDGTLNLSLVEPWAETGRSKSAKQPEDTVLDKLRSGAPWPTQKAAAAGLGVDPATVSRALRDAGLTLDDINDMEKAA